MVERIAGANGSQRIRIYWLAAVACVLAGILLIPFLVNTSFRASEHGMRYDDFWCTWVPTLTFLAAVMAPLIGIGACKRRRDYRLRVWLLGTSIGLLAAAFLAAVVWLEHVTVRRNPELLARLREFFGKSIDLEKAPRPWTPWEKLVFAALLVGFLWWFVKEALLPFARAFMTGLRGDMIELKPPKRASPPAAQGRSDDSSM